MLYVDGKAVGSGRAWARREGIVVPVDDAVAVAALEDAGQWDHVVLVGPSSTSAARAASAFAALDDLLAAAGPVLLFGGVDLPGRFRTAYADRATAAGEAPAVADRRDALLRALRATASGAPEDIAALGPPMRVTVGLFGAAATRRVGRALADAVGGGRWGAIQLATAASAILGPERLEPLLALEGDEPDVAVGPFADHLRDVLEPYTEIRRQTLLLDLWHEVTGHRDAVAARAHKRAWAAEIAGDTTGTTVGVAPRRARHRPGRAERRRRRPCLRATQLARHHGVRAGGAERGRRFGPRHARHRRTRR